MFNAINSSTMKNFATVQELLRMPENTQGQQNVFQGSRTSPVLIPNLGKTLGAQGRLTSFVISISFARWCKQFENFD